MHWVCATTPGGRPVHVNLAAVQTMLRLETVTAIFLGGMAIVPVPDGKGGTSQQTVWSRTDVAETPEQLFALKRIEVGVLLPPLPREIVAQAKNARPVEHVEPTKKRRAKA